MTALEQEHHYLLGNLRGMGLCGCGAKPGCGCKKFTSKKAHKNCTKNVNISLNLLEWLEND